MTIDPTLLEVINLIIRWTHVITGIAWIGSSFFFVFMDDSLEPAPEMGEGVGGQIWMIHGGGFYHAVKYKVAPGKMPEHLHWFKWEAGWTGITGVFLLITVFYLGAEGFLINADSDLSMVEAAGIGLGALVVSWLIYDFAWRLDFVERYGTIFTIIFFLALVGLTWAFLQVFTDRAAFIHVGAVIGLIMVLNVWLVIMPGQQKLVDALQAGQTPDPKDGIRAKRRSMHNSYVTLPVIFIMISGHYPTITGHPLNWLILGALILIGAAIRHWFIVRHTDKPPVWIWPSVIAASIALFFVVRPAPIDIPADAPQIAFSQVREIMAKHCTQCHAATPTHEAFEVAPKGILLDTAERIQRNASAIYAQTVQSDLMPLGNETEMTEDERKTLAIWIAQGAETE